MNMKEHILAALQEQFERWEALLATLAEGQITAPHFDLDWSIKDVMAHLWAWQQISVARVEAALHRREPEYPGWILESAGQWEENANQVNAATFEKFHSQPWLEIYKNWKTGFLRLLERSENISERDLLDGDKYSWLHGYSLAAILIASYDHHQEHFEKLTTWLQSQ